MSRDRAHVVYLGTNHQLGGLQPEPTEPRGWSRVAGRRFLLCLGTDFRHKNRVFAMRLLEALRRRHGWERCLVLAGAHVAQGSSAGDEAHYLTVHPELGEHVFDLAAVNEAEKRWLLEAADAMVYPTLYEGFGLVPFEAAEAGVPCLFARQTSLAELFSEDLALLVPWDADASADRVIPALTDPETARRLVAGIAAAGAPLTWRKTAERLVELYRMAVDRPAREAAFLAVAQAEHDPAWAELMRPEAAINAALVGPNSPLPGGVAQNLARDREPQGSAGAGLRAVADGLPLRILSSTSPPIASSGGRVTHMAEPVHSPDETAAHDAVRWFEEHFEEAAGKVIAFLGEDGIDVAGKTVADVGCGDGIIDLGVALRGGPEKLVGYDIRPTDTEALLHSARAAGMAEELPGNLSFAQCRPDLIPAPDNTFDVVITWSTFEHVEDPVQVLSEVRRVIKPDGVLFLQLWPFYLSEHGGHLWPHYPDPFPHLTRTDEAILDEVAGRRATDPTRTAEDEYQSLNRITLDGLQRALLANQFVVTKLRLLTVAVHIPIRLAHLPLSDVGIGGVELHAVPRAATP